MNKPTQEGYYWVKIDGGDWEVALFSNFQYFADEPGVWYRMAEWDVERIWSDRVSEWRGPLLPPTEEPMP